jgi:hypothetical protein
LELPVTHWIGGLVDPRAGLDDSEKRKFLTLTGLDLRPLGRPARSQLLYRLRYRCCSNRKTSKLREARRLLCRSVVLFGERPLEASQHKQAASLLLLASSSAYYSTLTMEAIYSSKRLGSLRTRGRCNQEDRNLPSYGRFNSKPNVSFELN